MLSAACLLALCPAAFPSRSLAFFLLAPLWSHGLLPSPSFPLAGANLVLCPHLSNQRCGWTSLWFSLHLQDTLSNNHPISHQEMWGKGVCYFHILEITWHPWSHTVKSPVRGEREHVSTHGPSALLSLGLRVGDLGFIGSLTRSGNLKLGERSNKQPSWPVIDLRGL